MESSENFMAGGALTRRSFLGGAFAAGAAALAPHSVFSAGTDAKRGRILLGACLTGRDAVETMKSIGFDFCEGGVADAVNPFRNGEWWKKRRDELRSLALPVRSLAGFIPGKFRLTGPKADHAPALDYAVKALERASEIGVQYVVLGSGAARNVPGKNPSKEELEKGVLQFTDFCRALAKRMEGVRGVTVVVEPLRARESNIVNTVAEGKKIVDAAGSPRIRLLADIFHMMEGNDGPGGIAAAGRAIKHCHVAECGTRSFPGDNPAAAARLEPYFAALKSIGYRGGVSCECGWRRKNIAKQLETAFKTLKGMI